MAKKICNQFFANDENRDTTQFGTLRCACCDETSEMPRAALRFDRFAAWIGAFQALHSAKGCNDKQRPVPLWAARKVGMSIAAENA